MPDKDQLEITPLPTLDEKLEQYENNPFTLSVTGLELLFKRAKQLSVGLFVLLLLGYSSNAFYSFPMHFQDSKDHPDNQAAQAQADFKAIADKLHSVPVEVWLLVVVMLLIALLVVLTISFIISGVTNYSAAQLAWGKVVTLPEALHATMDNFWSYSWTMFLMGLKVFLWSLLLILPGYVMAIRYSLTGVSFFDKGLKGNAAIKHSVELTRGAWLTTNAAFLLFPLITFGLLRSFVTTGSSAVLYRQYSQLSTTGGVKPKAHWLSWLTLFLPLIIFTLILLGITLILVVLTLTFTHGSGLAF